MQGRARGPLQPYKNYAVEKKISAASAAERAHQRCLRRDYRISLEKDISTLRRKLRQEVDTHRALERAFRRTLGVLPRFSPALTPKVQELLAEVAVLEEEVIHLEECIVALRQGLYNEALFLSGSKQQKEATPDSEPILTKEGPLSHSKFSPTSQDKQQLPNTAKAKRNCVIAKLLPSVVENRSEESLSAGRSDDTSDLQRLQVQVGRVLHDKSNNGQCNGVVTHQGCSVKPSSVDVAVTPRVTLSYQDLNSEEEKHGQEHGKQQKEADELCKIVAKNCELQLCASHSINLAENPPKVHETLPKLFSSHVESGDIMEPNVLSEEMVLCLSNIFLRLSRHSSALDWETSSNVSSQSTLSSMWSLTTSRNTVSCNPSRDVTEEIEFVDPYNTCKESIRRNVGPYQYYQEITLSSLDYSKIPRAALFLKKLMNLVERLRTVDLRGLVHQQKLSFWINIYNVCMLHAFLEHGIPDSPHMVVALMRKAVINVGGHLLSALAIEHFILRLPCDFGNAEVKSREKTMEGLMRSTYGLDWPEPLVSFALCCGSWSSPALRIYTPQDVESELEIAKTEYLQAAVGVTSSKIVIPKMLEWYMRDFAKDAEALMDWIAEQLPSAIGKSVQTCLMSSRHVQDFMEVMPYDFSFRYLFAVQPL